MKTQLAFITNAAATNVSSIMIQQFLDPILEMTLWKQMPVFIQSYLQYQDSVPEQMIATQQI